MSRRVVLGKRLDGTFGLDVSLEGFDALTDDRNDAGKFSFSSDWTDLTTVGAIGIADVPAGTGLDYTVPIPDYGYRPHAEVRLVSGNTIYDDYFNSLTIGMGCQVFSDRLVWARWNYVFRSLYIAYKEPMAIQ